MSVLVISQNWIKCHQQQDITWANVDQDPSRHMVSLGHSELNEWLKWNKLSCKYKKGLKRLYDIADNTLAYTAI